MKKLVKWFRYMIYALPVVLFLSYSPVISLGANETMNFELSVPLIWLVVFDVVGVIIMVQKNLFLRKFGRKWMWLLFPMWLTLSVVWSLNVVRGVLTVGILWLLYIAGYIMWSLKDLIKDVEFRERFWKVFFGSSLIVCGWCVLQCGLDVAGVARDYTLMCAGCTYQMFGFPHPNGFAIEPQFMGNLLLAPLFAAGYFAIKDKKYWLVFFVLGATLFLTFSRGAIYAFLVGLVVMTVWLVVCEKKKRKEVVKRIGMMWGVVILSFVLTLNMQGVMAVVSPTNDTYFSGVAKVINHLSLGVVDVDGEKEESDDLPEKEVQVVEVEVTGENDEEAVYDGYVAESTDTRLRLSGAAVEVWERDFSKVMFGVGLGGAGQTLYENGLSPAPKEIVQNQYASLLLETGVVGISLLIVTLILMWRGVIRCKNKVMIVSLVVAYMVSLCFFSGLPNALHIYLLPVVLLLV